ncbi:MAG: hypothetical protein CR997_05850 [Acidobacteria bacterium]|nr:MAG: hypothetical protein CR997_05850 [Acidobacteriota bacterium]
MDQAHSLKKLAQSRREQKSAVYPCEVLAVTSGKGGVGKTQISLNLALALSVHSRVLLLDADMGTANVDVLLGIDPRKNLSHVLNQEANISDILVSINDKLDLLPGTSGLAVQTPANFGWNPVIEEAERLSQHYDFILVDTAAGITETIIELLSTADRVLLVCTSEPTAIVDAYALCKTLFQRNPHRQIELIANSVQNSEEAVEIYTKIQGAIRHFLKRDISFLAEVPFDQHIVRSIHQQQPVFQSNPSLPISKTFASLAHQLKHSKKWTGTYGLSQIIKTLKK